MAYSHVAHDCVLGKEVILVNGVHLAGQVDINDHAFVSGNVVIHQFTKIGCHAFIGGGYRVVQDVPPYIMAAKGTSYVHRSKSSWTQTSRFFQ